MILYDLAVCNPKDVLKTEKLRPEKRLLNDWIQDIMEWYGECCI